MHSQIISLIIGIWSFIAILYGKSIDDDWLSFKTKRKQKHMTQNKQQIFRAINKKFVLVFLYDMHSHLMVSKETHLKPIRYTTVSGVILRKCIMIFFYVFFKLVSSWLSLLSFCLHLKFTGCQITFLSMRNNQTITAQIYLFIFFRLHFFLYERTSHMFDIEQQNNTNAKSCHIIYGDVVYSISL